jgi:hypothetical protein
MPKLLRILVLAAMPAALNLAGMTAVAHATVGGSIVIDDGRRPPTQGQVGESWHQRPVDQHTIAGDTWRPPTEGQQQPTDAVELYRRGERALQEQDTAVDATQRQWAWMQARQRADTATQTPAPVRPDEPNEQPGWLVVTLGVLAAVLAFVAGLAVLAARRANRRVGQAT